jgi:hypothetical protein
MTEYVISADKLQELNVLINEGGQIPTEVNKYTGETAANINSMDYNAARASNIGASKANDKSGGAWTNIQKWHDSVKASAPPVEPPPVQPPTVPVNGVLPPYAPGQGTAQTNMSEGQVCSFLVTADGINASFQVGASANAWCRIGVSDTPNVWVTGQYGEGKGAVNWPTVKAGQYVVMMFTQQSGLQNVRYSVQP